MIVIKSKYIYIYIKITMGQARGKQGASRRLGHLFCDNSLLKNNTKRCGCKSNPAKPISGRPRMTG